MPNGTAPYAWKENNACVATYKVLEGDHFLDQFEDADIPFATAGPVKLGTLRYFPKTTDNPQILEVLGIEMARKFLTYVLKVFTVSKENPAESSADILLALAGVFQDGGKTLLDLAAVTDQNLKFPDEA
jgi:hypothetical protein